MFKPLTPSLNRQAGYVSPTTVTSFHREAAFKIKNNKKAMVKRKNNSQSDAVPDWNYEAKVAEIEAIISQIESGELELEAVFDQFANAVESLRQCETFLQQRQQQVDLLIETLSDN